MLSKKVCKRCFKNDKSKWGWDQVDEQLWTKFGKVWCCMYKGAVIRLISNTVPKGCPYLLEHTVNAVE